MAEAAVTFLLENLQRVMVGQFNLITGFKRELKQLQNELELMKAFLEESAIKREKGEVYRQYEKQIREVVYHAENTVDDCLRQAAKEKGRGRLARLLPKRLDLAKTVRNLREKEVQPVFSQARMGFVSLPILNESAGTTAELPRTGDKKILLLREDKVVGFDVEAQTLIRQLTEKSEKLEVISIIGMPGLGKTTLAWKIYGNKRIQHEFETLIWVYVSQEFHLREIYLAILGTTIEKEKEKRNKDFESESESYYKLNDYQLAEKVRTFLLQKPKFLLVIDDVWTTGAWKFIEGVLPKSNRLGKVLITSRYENVARVANPSRDPYRLNFLDSEQSWELLQLEVWGNLNDCPHDLRVLGREIAKQCGGVPLAIVVIAGILAEKFSAGNIKDEWKKVAASVTSYLIYHDKEKRTEKIILLSYNTLRHDLRDCFLYLGMFPEDSEIRAWKLIRLWMAEGFIQRRPGEELGGSGGGKLGGSCSQEPCHG